METTRSKHRRRDLLVMAGACAVPLAGCTAGAEVEPPSSAPPALRDPLDVVDLPPPDAEGSVSIEAALAQRRSVREFTDTPLSLRQISQLFWAAQGQTQSWGGRTSPSAGALYPLEVFAATPEGLLHYLPGDPHQAEVLSRVDHRSALFQQDMNPVAILVFAGVYARTAAKYGERAERYVKIEAGHAAQNVLLQALALDLGAVPVGGYDDAVVARELALPADYIPLYMVGVGAPAS